MAPLTPKPRDNRLIHAHRFLARVKHSHMRSRCTILDQVIGQDEFNDETITFVRNPLLTAIPCYVEPARGAAAGEENTPSNTIVTDVFNVVLGGYYPQIDEEAHALIDDAEYDITAIASDDQHILTILTLTKVSV